eukprot:880986_1
MMNDVSSKNDDTLRLQQKLRKIKQIHDYSPSISIGSYGSFLFPFKSRIIADPWTTLPDNAKTLSRAKSTLQLQLKHKDINEIGTKSLTSFTNLRELYLNYNFISNSNGSCLFNLSKPLFRLQVLDLSFNLITNIEGIQHLRSLQHLNVSNNFISTLALRTTINVLCKLQFLEYLDIRYNPLTLNDNIKHTEQAIVSSLSSLSLKVLNDHSVDAIQRDQSFEFQDGKVIGFCKTFDPLKTRHSTYNATELTNTLFEKSIKITQH